MANIIGLDLSLTGTGWCVNTDLELKVGVVDTKKLFEYQRLDRIFSEIIGLLVQYKIERAVVEDFSFASKGRAVFQIGGLGYIIRYELWKRNIPVNLVAPQQLKKFATGKGNSDKSVVIKEIYKKWDADIDDDNAADAYVLTRIGRAYVGIDTDLRKYEQEVIDQIRSHSDKT